MSYPTKKEEKQKKRKLWVRNWILRRGQQLNNFLRMNLNDFNYLLELVSPIITKNDTKMRRSISQENV